MHDVMGALARRRARLAEVLARRRVPLGFACGAVVLWLARPTLHTVAAGGAIAVAGEAFRVWAAGHLEKGREVTRSGPYRLTRHPLYLGSSIIGVGIAVAAARLSVAALVTTYLATTISAAIRHEEANMRASFGDQYDAYLKSRGEPLDTPFSLERALRNREHHTIAALIAVGAIFVAKAVVSYQ